MMENKALIITSIATPNDALKKYAAECKTRKIHFIVIGDAASPKDFELEGCDFYSLERQKQLPFSICKIPDGFLTGLPLPSTAKKVP